MKKKELPKPSKSLKNFILDEDAKIIDKTATKIAITLSFLSISTIINVEDANAQGHKSHTNHENHIGVPNNEDQFIEKGDDGIPVIHDYSDLNNPENENIKIKDTVSGKKIEIIANTKSITSAHGNHYNHGSGGGSS